nr:DnaJ protein homolog [Ipomoea batatas]
MQGSDLEVVLPPRPITGITEMELDECEETTLHDVNIEEEMRRKQQQEAQEAYKEDDDMHGGAQRVQCAQHFLVTFGFSSAFWLPDAGDYVIGSGSSSYNICSSSEAFVDFSHYAQTEQHFDSSTSSSEEEAEPTSDGEDQRIPQNVSLQRGKAHIPDVDIPYYHTDFSFGQGTAMPFGIYDGVKSYGLEGIRNINAVQAKMHI